MKRIAILFITILLLFHEKEVLAQNKVPFYYGIALKPPKSVFKITTWGVKGDMGLQLNKWLALGVQPYYLKNIPYGSLFLTQNWGADIYSSAYWDIKRCRWRAELGLGSSFAKIRPIQNGNILHLPALYENSLALDFFVGTGLEYFISDNMTLDLKLHYWNIQDQSFHAFIENELRRVSSLKKLVFLGGFKVYFREKG